MRPRSGLSFESDSFRDEMNPATLMRSRFFIALASSLGPSARHPVAGRPVASWRWGPLGVVRLAWGPAAYLAAYRPARAPADPVPERSRRSSVRSEYVEPEAVAEPGQAPGRFQKSLRVPGSIDPLPGRDRAGRLVRAVAHLAPERGPSAVARPVKDLAAAGRPGAAPPAGEHLGEEHLAAAPPAGQDRPGQV